MQTSFSMRSRFFRTVAFCVLWVAFKPVVAQEKPVMRWLLVHFPPSIILVDDQPTNGTADVSLRLIMAQWPEVRHEFIVVKPARVWKELSEPDANACATLANATPEREKLYYLATTHITPPIGVVAKPEVLQTMAKNARGEVLPGALFDRSDLTGIISPGRSYGPVNDSMLSHRSPKAKIEEVTSWNGGSNILEMIVNGRADYTLEHNRALNYLMDTVPRLKNAGLESASIAGGQMNRVGIACPRNAWGYAAIKKIDAIVSGLASNPEFHQLNNKWLSAKERALLKPVLEAFYKARAKPTPPDRYTPP